VAAHAVTLRSKGARRWAIAVIDGPNMPNLGARDQAIYGPIRSIDELQASVRAFGETLGVDVRCMTSNHEGEILEFIHATAGQVDGYLINPAGLTTYGEATRHALSDTTKPYVEVHFSNLAVHLEAVSGSRPLESRFTKSATGLVMGLRQYSYIGALVALALSLDDPSFLGGQDGRDFTRDG
jgi:3-dehydroquinate dehydratase-2